MSDTAKLFMNGRSQAVRLPAKYRFEGDEVFIRRDPETGDVILSARPRDWGELVAMIRDEPAPDDFLSPKERDLRPATRDPLDGIEE